MAKRNAFTLIELLVVVAIIVALLAILMPSLNKAMAVGQEAVCRSNLHQVSMAVFTFSSEHNRQLPGLWGPPWTGAESWQGSWMGKEVFTDPAYQPLPVSSNYGTIVDHVGGIDTARKLYRCPSLQLGARGSGVGSNGMFDYTMFQCFPGARLTAMPSTATVQHLVTGEVRNEATPVITEEDPAFHINGPFIDMGHTSINRVATTHLGGGNYAAVDGSAHGLRFSGNPLGPEAQWWTAKAPSGATTSLGVASSYGGWNSR